MRDVCLLAWRSLSFHWLRNALLIGSLATALFVPAVVYVLVQRAAESLRERADSTPLVLGAAGSDTDLTLMSLYFAGRSATPISVGDVDAIDPQLATVLPLHVRFHARGRPVVGVTPDYFQHRGLTLSSGDAWQRSGDCLLGHQVAAELALRAGDRLTTDSETVFDLAGNYPLRMRVTGVLAATGTADDLAVFVALETAWILEGIGHGHTSAGEAGTESGDQPHSTAKPFTEVTEENAGSFHFHGRRAGFPLTSALVLPRDERAQTLLLGKYESREASSLQLAEPDEVMQRLLGAVLKARWFVIVGMTLLGLSAFALVVLVFGLTFRLRRGEFQTLRRIGASARRLAAIVACECVAVIVASASLAAVLTWTATLFEPYLLRWLL